MDRVFNLTYTLSMLNEYNIFDDDLLKHGMFDCIALRYALEIT